MRRRLQGHGGGASAASIRNAYDPLRVQTDRRAQTDPDRPGAAQRQAGGNAPSQAHRPPRLRIRPAVLGGVRARRSSPGAVHRGRVGVPLQPVDRGRCRGPDVHGRRLVPAERARLPERWRRLRGRHHQPRPQGGSDRRQRPAGGLRPDRRRVDRLRCGEPRLRDPVRRRAQDALRDRGHRAADADEPAGRQGVRQALRHPHLSLRGGRLRHDRLGCVPRSCPRRDHARPDLGLRDQARASGPGRPSPSSSCCCGRSPPAVRR